MLNWAWTHFRRALHTLGQYRGNGIVPKVLSLCSGVHAAGLSLRGKKGVGNANRNEPAGDALCSTNMVKTQDHRRIIEQWLAVRGG